MAEAAPPKTKKPQKTKRGKTVDPEKVNDLETWAKYFKRGYQNVIVDEDGSFVVLDPELTKTDFPAALTGDKKPIKHLMGEDYINVLADPKSSSELRAAAEARLTQINDMSDARINAAKLAYSEAETELMNITQRWKSAPDVPTRITLARAVAEANATLVVAERDLRTAQAPHRYILEYSDIRRSMLKPGSGDDRPIRNIIYRAVPAVTEAPERVVMIGAAGNSPASMRSTASNV
jgi:hypothetical protein